MTPPAAAIRRSIVPLALAGLLIAACSSDSGDTSTDSTSSAASDAPESSTPPATSTAVSTDDTSEETTADDAAPSGEASDEPETPAEPEPSDAGPAGPLPTPSVTLESIGSFDEPVEIARRPGDPRPFVVENPGRVVAADESGLEVVVDLTDIVSDEQNEQGLLGLAFHPAADLAYIHFTSSDGATVVAELAVDPATGSMDPSTLRPLFEIDQPFANHNGGELDFGPDGLLYLGLGDGGSADDPLRSSLDLSTPLGKILRFDPIGAGDEAFATPPDNPFADVDGADPRVWSFGLRNPWKFSFDPLTGDLWVADVGQNRLEEVTVARAAGGLGAGRATNFGWSAFEGDEPFNSDQPTDGHLSPTVTYGHDDGRCSISGGAVARSSSATDLNGWYVYGDYCSGEIFALDTTTVDGDPVVIELGSVDLLTAIAEAGDGEIYVASQTGTVSRVIDR